MATTTMFMDSRIASTPLTSSSSANVAAAPEERASRSLFRNSPSNDSRSKSRDAQLAEQKANILNQTRGALQAHEAADIDDAVRASRSRSRTRDFIKSVSRSLSREPYTREQQAQDQKAAALAQVRYAQEAFAYRMADDEQRASRSSSRNTSRDASRSASRTREVVV